MNDLLELHVDPELQAIRNDCNAIQARIDTWEPAPCPKDWQPEPLPTFRPWVRT